MKYRLWIFFCTVLLILACCYCAYAETTITAMATDIDPNHLEKVSSYARILEYNEEKNTLSVELIVPEIFAEDDILDLEIGDKIFTSGSEVEVQTIDWYEEYGYLVINAGIQEHAPGSIYLHEDRWGNYIPERYAHKTYNTIAVIECPITDHLLFLDYISSDTCDALDLPSVYTAIEFLEIFRNTKENGTVGPVYLVDFDIDNVYVVFDGNGQVATIQRFFVSWE